MGNEYPHETAVPRLRRLVKLLKQRFAAAPVNELLSASCALGSAVAQNEMASAPKKSASTVCRGHAVSAVARDVTLEQRMRPQRLPCRIVTAANAGKVHRGIRPLEVTIILDLPSDNPGVAQGRTQARAQTGRLQDG